MNPILKKVEENRIVIFENPATFEEGLPIINAELIKRKYKWHLTAVAYFDYDDVCQIIRTHIYNKWNQYDSSRPFRPWINKIISSQIKNILRNIYWNFERPCLRCSANLQDGHCSMTKSGNQCDECPLFKKWARTKKNAHDIKLAVSMENHEQEVSNRQDDFCDDESNTKKLNVKLKEQLKPAEWRVYHLLYVQNKEDHEVAKIMGFKTNEAGRSPGYKRLKQIRSSIIVKAKKILAEGLD
jgi:RNA polymerase sigma factor (sigma-70 family)